MLSQWLKFSERAGMNVTTPSPESHKWIILQFISLYFNWPVQDMKFQSPENRNNSGNPKTYLNHGY